MPPVWAYNPVIEMAAGDTTACSTPNCVTGDGARARAVLKAWVLFAAISCNRSVQYTIPGFQRRQQAAQDLFFAPQHLGHVTLVDDPLGARPVVM
jgi:hypothetical protein